MPTPTELLKKLQIRAGSRLWLINVPHHYAEELTAGAEVETVRAGESYDGVIAFCENPVEVESFARQAIPGLPRDGLLWLAYRKGATGKVSGLSRDIGWDAVGQLGFRTVRSVAIDDVWTGLRFRPVELVKSKN
jgi:hypothetical protein